MIFNVSKETVIADDFSRAVTPWQQTRGLMFKKISPLVFEFSKEQKVSLHSFFCRTMDLIFLNDEWEVVELYREWSPFCLYFSKEPAKFLIELPPGSIFNSSTMLGDIVHFR